MRSFTDLVLRLRSSTSSRSRKKARATPTTPVSSQKSSSKRPTNKKAAKSQTAVLHPPSEDSDDKAGLAPLHRPRRTAAANCSAIQPLLHTGESDSDSEVLGEAAAISSSSGHGRQASSRSVAVSSTYVPPSSSQVTSPSPTQDPPDSIVDLATANASVSGFDARISQRSYQVSHDSRLPPGKHPAWSPGDSDSDGGDSTGGGAAATPPNLSNKLVESSNSSGDESTLAGSSKPKSQAGSAVGSGFPPLDSPTVAVRPPHVTTSAPLSAAAKAPVSPKPPPPARSPVRPATSTSKSSSVSKAKAVVPAGSAKDEFKPKPASKAKSTAAIRSAKDGSNPKSGSKTSAGKAKLAASDTKARAKSDGGVPPHHFDVKVLVARAAASARLDSRESGPTKGAPVFPQGLKALLGDDHELLRCFGDHGEDCRWRAN
ncbi:unnamed protein product [Phytophthora fragariaefolia]|uniref:Unnamed protein product n=1 Tax=Phytophthora fragariaefolia TaxID=1490495 RepID=A0A9W7CWE6_9STRA|nr:unnamed protein product [Phytophthora fragariaefolia]